MTLRQRVEIREDNAGSLVPCQHIPSRRANDCRERHEGIKDPLQPRCYVINPPELRNGLSPKGNEEEVLSLCVGEHQCTGKTIENRRRWRAATALFEPGVPSRADVGTLRHFLAPQSGSATTPGFEAQGGRVKLSASVSQIASKVVRWKVLGIHGGTGYTRIKARI